MANKPNGEIKVDIWSKKNICVVCEETCVTSEEKKEHEAKQPHIKKFTIYKFCKTHLKSSSPSIPSSLTRRFRTSKEKAAGIECLYELRFPWAASGWWVCSICHESGCTLEQAEHHVRSPAHLTKYLEEFDPDKAVLVKKFESNPVEHYTELIKARDELFEIQGELPPEIFELDLSKEDAMVQLMIANLPNPPKETLPLILKENDTAKRVIIRCTICHEVIPCYKKNLTKAWTVHESTRDHRKASAILGILKHLPFEEILEDDSNEIGIQEFSWKKINNNYFGPICGKSFLLTCGSQHFCLLCHCEIGSIQEHFSSEYHILRFLSIKKTQEIIPFHQQTGDVRRSKMLDLLSKIPLDNEKFRKMDTNKIPTPILDLGNYEKLAVIECMPVLVSFGMDAECLICRTCNAVVKVNREDTYRAEQIWNEHVNSPAHFDVIARRACFHFFDEFFVPLVSTVKTLPTDLHGEWKNVSSDEKNAYKVQTQCDVGLEWIVEDQEAGEVVCTLCARTYKKENVEGISNHIRSYVHVNQYLNINHKDFLALLLAQTSEQAVLDLIMDWLQMTYRPCPQIVYDYEHMLGVAIHFNFGHIRVYNPEKAAAIGKKMDINWDKLLLPYMPPDENRELEMVYRSLMTSVCEDSKERSDCLLNMLLQSPCRIVYLDDQDNKLSRRWLIRCMACEMVFSTTVEHLARDVFDLHLMDQEHDRRIQEFETLQADRYRYATKYSNHTVKQFLHNNPSKPVAWHFHSELREHVFVLTVVGLEDILERKSSLLIDKKDFFCRLCFKSIPHRSYALETHVRSRDHVINYVRKYFPMTIYELEKTEQRDPKVERAVLARVLKDIKPTEEYCIPMFDPIGEQEKKRELAEEEANKQVKESSLVVLRKKAEEQRLAREEQKKRINAKKDAMKARAEEERQKKERELKENSVRMQVEMDKLKEELKKKTEQQVKEAAEKARLFAMAQAGRSKIEEQLMMGKSKIEEHLKGQRKAQVEIELARLAELKAKEEALRKERTFNEAQRTLVQLTQDLLNKHNISAPPHSIPSMFEQLPPMSMMNIPPPVPNFSVPPPGWVGPKPSFPNYVPSVGAMPVYPMGAEDMEISRGRSRSPSPRSRRRSRRSRSRSRTRSRSRDRYFRRRSRSRTHTPKRSPHNGWKPHGLRDISPDAIHRDRDMRRNSFSPVSISPPPDERRITPKRTPVKSPIRNSLRSRTVDEYISNPALCTNRVALVDYISRKGAERIPSNELPKFFSEAARKEVGNIGVDSLYEVVCIDSPDLDTFYCALCGIWNTPSEILSHLTTTQHKHSYLYKFEKDKLASVMREPDPAKQELMIKEAAIEIYHSKKPDEQEVVFRLNTVIDKKTIQRLWPEHVLLFNNSWKNDFVVAQAPPSVPISNDVLSGFLTQPQIQASGPVMNNMPIFNPNMPPPTMGLTGHILPPTNHAPMIPVGSFSGLKERKRSRSPKGFSSRRRSRDRRRSPSPKRRDSFRRSPFSKRRSRSPMRDRDERKRDRDDRRRSRSRDRDRRRSRSRDRRKDDIRDNKVLNKEDLQWMTETARFMESIQQGNTSYSSGVPGMPPIIPYGMAPPVGASSLQQMHPLSVPSASTVPTNPAKVITIEDGPVIPKDEGALQRRVLGLMLVLQQEVEKTGCNVSLERAHQLYREMGLDPYDKDCERMIHKLSGSFQNSPEKKVSINLAEFGITPRAAPPPAPQYPSYPYEAPSQQYQPKDDSLQRILSGIQPSLAQLKSNRPPSPIVKPLPYQFSRTEDFYKDTGFNMVYPESRDDLDREKKEKMERKQKASEKIAATIEALRAQNEKLQNSNDEDDDWDVLESDLGNLLGEKKSAPTKIAGPAKDDAKFRRESSNFGVPNTWAQPVPQPIKPQEAATPSVSQEQVPVVPGQKIPLQRTVLPNGMPVQPTTSTAPLPVSSASSTPTQSTYPSFQPTVPPTAPTAIATVPPPGQGFYPQYNQYQQYQPQQLPYGQQFPPPGTDLQQQPFFQQNYLAPPPQFGQQFQSLNPPGTLPPLGVGPTPGIAPPGIASQQYYGGYQPQQQYRY